MTVFLALTITGLITGCIYAISASGLVVTYTTSGVFNFAHGAVGMIAAFTYWTLSVQLQWPAPVAVVVTLFVVAPLMGALIERLLIRPLGPGTPALSVNVTLGLLLLLVGVASTVWNPATARRVPLFFDGQQVTILGTSVSWHQLVVVICAVAVAVGLRLLLFRTRAGVSLRAVVDDPALVGLTGAPPARYSQLGWMLGSFLAALAGVLLAALVNLDIQTLTLLVVNAYAAALWGRMRNLPVTFAGGLALGLLNSYAIGYLPVGPVLSTVGPLIPMIFLFLVLLVLPEQRLETHARKLAAPRIPRLPESLIVGAALIVIAFVLSYVLSNAWITTASYAIAFGLILLSLVPLTGYAGQICLCQFTFAGLGAVVMAKVGGGDSYLGLLLAAVVAGVAGAIIALPALRVRGLYLALLTLAFAQAMDLAFFNNAQIMGVDGAVDVGRITIPGFDLQDNRNYLVFLSVIFSVAAVGVLALRRSRFGRYLVAVSDNEVGATMYGMSIAKVKIAVFSACAAFAGLAGALYGGQTGLVGPADFNLLISLAGLLILTLMGTRTVTGALLGAVGLAVFPVIQVNVPILRNFSNIFIGLGAMSIGKNPNGAVGGDNPAAAMRRRRLLKKIAEENARAEQASIVETTEKTAGHVAH